MPIPARDNERAAADGKLWMSYIYSTFDVWYDKYSCTHVYLYTHTYIHDNLYTIFKCQYQARVDEREQQTANCIYYTLTQPFLYGMTHIYAHMHTCTHIQTHTDTYKHTRIPVYYIWMPISDARRWASSSRRQTIGCTARIGRLGGYWNRGVCVSACCSVLQCVTVCCSLLRCVAVRFSVLRCVSVCCISRWATVLTCPATYRPPRQRCVRCSVLQCVAVCCSALHLEAPVCMACTCCMSVCLFRLTHTCTQTCTQTHELKGYRVQIFRNTYLYVHILACM